MQTVAPANDVAMSLTCLPTPACEAAASVAKNVAAPAPAPSSNQPAIPVSMITDEEKKQFSTSAKLSLGQLVNSVADEMANGADFKKIHNMMERYDYASGDWKRYCFYDAKCNYTRNLIATDNKHFTLMLLCWNPGKQSPAHDHPQSQCFMKIVDGALVETRYAWPKPGEEGKPLEETGRVTGECGAVVFINDSMGLHRVANMSTVGACSLHLYVPPYQACKAWCTPEKTSKFFECNVTFYTENGKKVAQ